MSVATVDDTIEAVYAYTDRHGAPLFEVVRRPGKPKRFQCRRWEDGRWRWDVEGVNPVPYRWPELDQAANCGDDVFVVEGEKDADRLATLGLTATTSPRGANWPWPDTWAEHFRGCGRVFVLADNDEPGHKAAHERAAIIRRAVADVRIVDRLPGVGPKGDVSDYLDAGHTVDDIWKIAETGSPPDTTGQAAAENNSWQPVDIADLLASGLTDQPAPTVLERTDGTALFYAGKTHSLNGESESGKSWLACLACLDQIRKGETATFLDFEDDAQTNLSRMLAIGATPDQLTQHFNYARPTEPIPVGTIFDLAALHSTIVVIDGVTEAMALHDLDPDKNRDSAKFMKLLVRPLAMAGAAVVQVDHVTKNPEQRGKYAIGAQHKRAAITGAMYSLAVAKPFGRGMAGLVNITVEKDKPGHVRRAASGRKAAEFHISSNPDGTIVTAELRPPVGNHANSDRPFRPTVLMERVSRRLENAGETGLSVNGIKAAVTGNKDALGTAAKVLAEEGYVTIRPQGQALYHVSVKSYRRADDPLDDSNATEEP